jgi:hypothetical protein
MKKFRSLLSRLSIVKLIQFYTKGNLMKTKTNNTRGRIETPPMANLSALSFRLHKKGHACRGMSDKAKNIMHVVKIF